MKNHKLGLFSILPIITLIIGSVVSTPSANAQDWFQELMNETNELIQEAEEHLDEAEEEGRKYQEYKAGLLNACLYQNNVAACNEYSWLAKRDHEWWVNQYCLYTTGLNRCH